MTEMTAQKLNREALNQLPLRAREAKKSVLEVSLLYHCHAGVQAGIKIVPYPPWVIPFALPVMSYPLYVSEWMASEPISIAEHEHEVIGIPSLGASGQTRIGNAMMSHSHTIVGVEVEVEGDICISTVELLPPPIL